MEYAALNKKIGRVLKRFTPIDPTDGYSMGEDYEAALPSIISMLLRDPNRNALLTILEQTRREYDVSPDAEKDGKIADAVLKSAMTGAPPPKPKITYRLDLRNDAREIESYIINRVREFGPNLNIGPGKTTSVGQIVIGFECSQSGWVTIVFDTRPEPENDGEWTLHIDSALMLGRDHWVKAGAANCRGTIAIVDAQGTERKYSEGEAELTERIGNMIRDLVTEVQKRGLFSGLPIATVCEIIIEDFNGGYSWPDGEAPSILLPSTM